LILCHGILSHRFSRVLDADYHDKEDDMIGKTVVAFAMALASPVDLPFEFKLDDEEGRHNTVSVVIPTFNRGYILGDTLRSALDQSHRDVEVIVVDDGSTDDTADVVRGFGERVRYLRQENAGVCAARNRGLRESRGEFVALLDSDDQWLPWKLEAQMAVMRKCPDVGMVWTDMVAVDEKGCAFDQAYLRKFYGAHKKLRIEDTLHDAGVLDQFWQEAPVEVASSHIYEGDLFSPMILGNLVHTSTVLLRRSRLARIGGFDTNLRRSGEDYEFHLRTCSCGPVAFLDASSILYRVGAADQLTAPKYSIDIATNNLTTVSRWIAAGEPVLDNETMAARLAESFAWLGEEEFLVGRHRDARGHLATSVKLGGGITARRAAMLAFTVLPRRVFNLANSGRKAVRRLL
jgi:glycosyltransferase involved in cell wall biosynthesis